MRAVRISQALLEHGINVQPMICSTSCTMALVKLPGSGGEDSGCEW